LDPISVLDAITALAFAAFGLGLGLMVRRAMR
jgi:hypothetical protein